MKHLQHICYYSVSANLYLSPVVPHIFLVFKSFTFSSHMNSLPGKHILQESNDLGGIWERFSIFLPNSWKRPAKDDIIGRAVANFISYCSFPVQNHFYEKKKSQNKTTIWTDGKMRTSVLKLLKPEVVSVWLLMAVCCFWSFDLLCRMKPGWSCGVVNKKDWNYC